MNSIKKQPPQGKIGAPMNAKRPFPPVAHKHQSQPKVAQRTIAAAQAKTHAPVQSMNRPVAPPVYRPQPVPKVLQTKAAPGQSRKPVQPSARVVGPPAARREVRPIVQPKAIATPRKAAPPAYHSKQVRPVIQRAAAKFGRDLEEPAPEKLEFEESKDGTTCAMIVWRPNGIAPVVPERTFSSGGKDKYHAEEKALITLQGWVNDGTLTPQAGSPHYVVYFQISKSPCSSEGKPKTRDDGQPGCLQRLAHLRDHGLKKHGVGAKVTFHVILAATKPYYGKVAGGKAASKENYDEFGGGEGGDVFDFMRS